MPCTSLGLSLTKKITKDDLFHWAKNATWHQISEYTVAWIADDDEKLETAGWTTLSNLIALKNKTYNVEKLSELLDFVEKKYSSIEKSSTLHHKRFCDFDWLICFRIFLKAFFCSENIGVVKANIKNTFYRVPVAKDYIQKAKDSGQSMAKKKTVRC